MNQQLDKDHDPEMLEEYDFSGGVRGKYAARSDPSKADKKDNGTSHAGLWWILIAGGVLLVALLVLSIFLPNLSERVKFFTVNTLSLLVLVAIAVQAYIYRRQWEVMKEQMGQAKEQAKFMDRSLVVETRAYVAIHGVELDLRASSDVGSKRTIFMRVENVGKVPADKIKVHLDMMTVIPKKWMPERAKAISHQVFDYDYGSTKLFLGNFKILIGVPLDKYLSFKEITCIAGRQGVLTLEGHIQYHDGFNNTEYTSFSFRYGPQDREWIPNPTYWEEDWEEDLGEGNEEQEAN